MDKSPLALSEEIDPVLLPPRGSHGATLARGAFFNTIAFLISNLRGIFTLLVARLLGSAVLGTFGLAWAATDLVSKIGTCGLDTAAITFVARREAAGDAAGSRQIMKVALAVAVLVSTALAIAGIICIWIIGRELMLRPELTRATKFMLFALPGIALYRVSNALSRGKGVMHHDIYTRGLTESLGTTAALLIAFALGARELAPEIAVIAGTLASGIVAFVLARRLFTGPSTAPATEVRVGLLVKHGVPIALYDLLNIGIMQIDLIMLGVYVGRVPGVTLETLGMYAAACDMASGLRKVHQAFNPIFIPVVAPQIAARQIRAAEASYGYLARWMLAVLLPLVAILSLSGGAIMMIYGAAFRVAGPWVAIVGVACALNAFVALGETILMIERPGVNLFNSIVAFAAAIGLNLLLIPAFGPLGAAIGMLIPYSIHGVLRGVQMSRLFDWHWPIGALVKPWMAALAALPLALLVRVFAQGIWMELAASLVYLAGYFAAWRFIGLDPSDRDVLNHLFHKRA